MTEEERQALIDLALAVSGAFARFAQELGDRSRSLTAVTSVPHDGEWGPAHSSLPWSERVLRQCLIIHQILSEGGKVSKDRWYEIAAQYGYTGRAISSFFRSGGLLEMRRDMVVVGKRGKERLAQNQARVDAALGKK